ncbi:hypothetical protein FB45DRAFT_1059634 [Roridomyces roridus]|uniref:Uncharacterized protein n=1 Tax=Roridomyces roridus TaxID=1738132 RepID=A0AAD7BSK7_9AGAR|nr:hypothetical protein FB45DRAFT_1059634 [Roridomyces roridus]
MATSPADEDKYTVPPTADEDEALLGSGSASDDEAEDSPSSSDTQPSPSVDPRFVRPTPSVWKRFGLLIFVVFLFWLAFQLQAHNRRPQKVIHANRYSKEFKFRPAASPVITQTLKDGRVRVHGAPPATSDTGAAAAATPGVKSKSKTKSKKKGTGKKKRVGKGGAKRAGTH